MMGWQATGQDINTVFLVFDRAGGLKGADTLSLVMGDSGPVVKALPLEEVGVWGPTALEDELGSWVGLDRRSSICSFQLVDPL